MSWLVIIPILFALIIIVIATLSKSPPGLISGRLQACPDSPNCVCSEGGEKPSGQVSSLAFSGSSGAAWARARQAIIATGGEIRGDSEGYLWAIYTTRWLHFIDDVELRMNATGHRIEIRSASRIGYSDLGVNRQRVEQIREIFSSGRESG